MKARPLFEIVEEVKKRDREQGDLGTWEDLGVGMGKDGLLKAMKKSHVKTEQKGVAEMENEGTVKMENEGVVNMENEGTVKMENATGVEMLEETGANTEANAIVREETPAVAVDAEVVESDPEGMRELIRLEGEVKDGLKKFRIAGECLTEIRNKKLYKLRKCKNFKTYCSEVFQVSASYAYKLLAYVDTCKVLGVSPDDVTERVIRPLTEIKNVAERKKVWEELKIATGDNEYPAAKEVGKAVLTWKREHKSSADAAVQSGTDEQETETPVQEQPEAVASVAEPADAESCPPSSDCGDETEDSNVQTADGSQEKDLAQELIEESLEHDGRHTSFEKLWLLALPEKENLTASQKTRIKQELVARLEKLYDDEMK